MNHPDFVPTCVAPGGQHTLFHLSSDHAPTYTVLDRHGVAHATTASLGVAMTAARRVLREHGEVWLRASDDTCAHIDPHRVATDTPQCAWIRTVAASIEGEHQ